MPNLGGETPCITALWDIFSPLLSSMIRSGSGETTLGYFGNRHPIHLVRARLRGTCARICPPNTRLFYNIRLFSSSRSDGCFHTVIETYICREESAGQICSHNARRRGRRGVQDKGVTLGPIFQDTKLCITTAISQCYRFQEL